MGSGAGIRPWPCLPRAPSPNLLTDRIARLLRRPYSVVVGHLLLLAGFYFLVSALVIPQMATLDRARFAPLVAPSPGIIAGLGAEAVALLGVGAWGG